MLTLTDSTKKIFIDLVDRWMHQSNNIEAFLVLGFSNEIMVVILAVGDDAFGAIGDKVGVKDGLALAGSYVRRGCRVNIVDLMV